MLTYNKSIRNSLFQIMEENQHVLLLGLGITDPKRFFGTTNELVEKYGYNRVLECPTSENAYLGHAFGLALNGFSPIVHFQRMDFMLYAFDQLINNIAKWNDMFDRKIPTNLVIRTLVGMGWGQGAQHAQNLAPFLSQIPGLKVIAPSCPSSASGLLNLAIKDGSPIIFIEHRWLQNLTESATTFHAHQWEIGKSLTRRKGNDLLIVTWSYGAVEALRFQSLFPEIEIEIIDLLSLSPLDIESVIKAYSNIKKMIIWEPAISFGGIGAEIIAQISEHGISGETLRFGHRYSNLSSSPNDFDKSYLTLDEIVFRINQKFSLNLVLKSNQKFTWPIDQDNNNWSPWT